MFLAKEQKERSSSSDKGQTTLTLNSCIIHDSTMIEASRINNSMPFNTDCRAQWVFSSKAEILPNLPRDTKTLGRAQALL